MASTSEFTVTSVRPTEQLQELAVKHVINSVHSHPVVTTALRYIVQIQQLNYQIDIAIDTLH